MVYWYFNSANEKSIRKKNSFIICGGISAYKSLEQLDFLKKMEQKLKLYLLNSAKEFVTPFLLLRFHKVKFMSDLFSIENETEMDHIALSRWADVIIIAPATANTISKLAQGTSDDLGINCSSCF